MRLVLDTNVLIAALIARGKAHTLYEYCVRQHTIVGAAFILNEVHEKLITKFKYSAEIADEAIQLLQSKMEVITPIRLPQPICRDPDDDTILAIAITGTCEYIITGDKDLLILQQHAGVNIIRPADFLTQEEVE
jgi:uncharacterized protein